MRNVNKIFKNYLKRRITLAIIMVMVFYLSVLQTAVYAQCNTYQVYESFSTTIPTQGGTWAQNSMTFSSNNPRSGSRTIAFNATGDWVSSPLLSSPKLFSFWYRRSSNTTSWSLIIETSPDNVVWTTQSTLSTATETYQQFTLDLDALSLTNVYVRLRDNRVSGVHERYIDDLSWTSTNSNENLTIVPALGTNNCTVAIIDGLTYKVYDGGGISDSYNSSQNNTIILSPSVSGKVIEVTANSVTTESSTSCGDYDWLKLFNGNSTTGTPLSWTQTGCVTRPLPTAPITSTDPNGNITVQFKSDVSTNAAGFDITVNSIDALTCFAPSALTNTNIIDTGADHSWTAASPVPSNGYEWAVTTSATPPASGNATTGTTASSTMLSPTTTYYLHVRSDCGAGDFSSWSTSSSFYTGHCLASSTSSASWISAFSTTGGASNITHTAASGATGGYLDLTSTNTASNYIGNPTSFSITSGGGTVGNAIWVDWNNSLVFETGERMYVSSGYGTTVTGSFAVPAAIANGSYRMRVITDYNTLAPSNPCGNISRGEYKDFTFEVISPPSCVAPSALTNTNITDTSADHAWTAASPTPSVGYEWAVTTSSMPPATGTPTTGTTAISIATLSGSTVYYLHVRSDCGAEDFSAWATSASFTTQLVVPVPYNEPFTTTTTPAGYGITGWTIGSIRGVTGNPGNNIYKNIFSSGTSGTFTTVNIGAISSGMYLTFDYKNSNYSSPYNGPGAGTGNFAVSISTDYGVTYTLLSTVGNTSSNAWQQYSQDLTSFAGQNVKIKIVGTWVSGDYDLAFDNIKVEAPPSCIAPTALTNTNITDVSADHAWTAASPTPSVGYEWAVTTSSMPPATGTPTTGTTASSIATLSGSTVYYLHVRSDCGAGDFSSWATSTSFTTSCSLVSTFSSDFETTTGSNFPDCWSKVGSTGTANSQASTGITGARNLYMYNGATVSLPPVDNASAGTHRLRMKVRANFTIGETVFVGYLTDPKDASTFVSLGSIVTNSITVPQDFVVQPINTPSGITTLAVKTGTAALSFLVDEVVYEAIPNDAVDYGNLQYISLSNPRQCQNNTIYAQCYEPGVTEAAGAGAGITAWIGTNTTDTDPSTWAESAWTLATFNVNVGNNDEYKATLTNLPLNTYYVASRFILNGGPYRYGGTNNGFWDGTTHLNGLFTVVTQPDITVSGTPLSICDGESSNLSVSSTNDPNYTYEWNPGMIAGFNPTVTPTLTTIYTVTAKEDGNTCKTEMITITVNPLPSTIITTPSTSSICAGGSAQELVASGGELSASGTIGSGIATNTTITPYKGFWGGNKSQFLYRASELTALGFVAGTSISTISMNIESFASPYTYNDFTISMKNTSSIVLTTTLETGTSTVLAPSNFVLSGTAPFSVTHILTTSFVWDGTSSLLVEYCFNNNNGGGSSGNSASVLSHTAGGNYTAYFSSDNNGTVCGSPGIGTTSTTRPNTIFGFGNPTSITWSPTTGLFIDMAGTVPYMGTDLRTVYAVPSVNTTYTVTATSAAGCTSTATALVNIGSGAVTNGNNAGSGSLRAAIDCAAENDVITIDPMVVPTVMLTEPINITKSLTITGATILEFDFASPNPLNTAAYGLNVIAAKTLTLTNINVVDKNNPNAIDPSILPVINVEGTINSVGVNITKQ